TNRHERARRMAPPAPRLAVSVGRAPRPAPWQARRVTPTAPAPVINLLAPASFAHGQPHDQFAWLREHDPVHWHPEPGNGKGFWAVTRYADVKAVGRDAA